MVFPKIWKTGLADHFVITGKPLQKIACFCILKKTRQDT
jgi:hypothetical protein